MTSDHGAEDCIYLFPRWVSLPTYGSLRWFRSPIKNISPHFLFPPAQNKLKQHNTRVKHYQDKDPNFCEHGRLYNTLSFPVLNNLWQGCVSSGPTHTRNHEAHLTLQIHLRSFIRKTVVAPNQVTSQVRWDTQLYAYMLTFVWPIMRTAY